MWTDKLYIYMHNNLTTVKMYVYVLSRCILCILMTSLVLVSARVSELCFLSFVQPRYIFPHYKNPVAHHQNDIF